MAAESFSRACFYTLKICPRWCSRTLVRFWVRLTELLGLLLVLSPIRMVRPIFVTKGFNMPIDPEPSPSRFLRNRWFVHHMTMPPACVLFKHDTPRLTGFDRLGPFITLIFPFFPSRSPFSGKDTRFGGDRSHCALLLNIKSRVYCWK
jgi:hypothetical protein